MFLAIAVAGLTLIQFQFLGSISRLFLSAELVLQDYGMDAPFYLEKTVPQPKHDWTTIIAGANSKRSIKSNIPKQQQQERPKKKPIEKFYAIHIGPSKTGTSAIQKNMATNPFEENTFAADKDNLIYVGKRVGDAVQPYVDVNKEIRNVPALRRKKNQTHSIAPENERRAYLDAVGCMKQILDDYYNSNNDNTDKSVLNERLEKDEETRSSLKKHFRKKCWIRRGIDFRYMLDYSIVDSEEGYSYKSKHGDNGNQFFLFDILGYRRLLVVGAYRRYADWLVSAYTERIKGMCLSPNLEGSKKDVPCLVFRDFLNHHIMPRAEYQVRRFYDPISVTLPECIERGPSKLQAKILNHFQLPRSSSNPNENATNGLRSYKSITTELYCDAFGEDLTPHTCSHALKIEREKAKSSVNSTSSLVANKGSLSDPVYQHIVAAGYRYGFLLFTNTEQQEIQERRESCRPDGKKPVWCQNLRQCATSNQSCAKDTKQFLKELDQITLGGNNTIVGTSTSNITMFKELSSYHTEVHQKSWTKSLPIICPPRETLEKLLEKSLAMEEVAMPDFYASPLGKEEHTRLFWNVWLRERKKFCWVDTIRLFEGVTSWNEIIDERMVRHDWGKPIEYMG